MNPSQPSHLGLLEHSDATTPIKQIRSLSTRTAEGASVSILNDDSGNFTYRTPCSLRSTANSISSGSVYSTRSYRQVSVPDMTPDFSPLCASRTRSPIDSPPPRLPSLSALIQAVSMSSHHHHEKMNAVPLSFPPPQPYTRHFDSNEHHHEHHHHGSSHPCLEYSQSIQAPFQPICNYVIPRTLTKRKYICHYADCGKAFTTSGHLSRHHRIHTGEKNYPCLHPGCTSRFSRQDNMMQHYRTHLSPRSRRNRFTARDTAPISAISQSDASSRSAFSPYRQQHPYSRPHSPQPSHMQWPF